MTEIDMTQCKNAGLATKRYAGWQSERVLLTRLTPVADLWKNQTPGLASPPRNPS